MRESAHDTRPRSPAPRPPVPRPRRPRGARRRLRVVETAAHELHYARGGRLAVGAFVPGHRALSAPCCARHQLSATGNRIIERDDLDHAAHAAHFGRIDRFGLAAEHRALRSRHAPAGQRRRPHKSAPGNRSWNIQSFAGLPISFRPARVSRLAAAPALTRRAPTGRNSAASTRRVRDYAALGHALGSRHPPRCAAAATSISRALAPALRR